MKRSIRNCMLLVLSLTILLSTLTVPAYAAASARFDSGSTCEVSISQTLLRKKGRQYATVKLKTHAMGLFSSWNSGAKVTVTLYDGDTGRHIWTGQKRGGDTLRLGDDHARYIIRVTPYSEPVRGNFLRKRIIEGNNFTNRGKCYRWSFSNQKNCTLR